MNNRLHETIRPARIGRRLENGSGQALRVHLLVLLIGILMFCLGANVATAQPPQASEAQKAAEPSPDGMAGGRAPVPFAEVQALDEQIKRLQQELTEFVAVRPVPGGTGAPVPQPSQTDERVQRLIQQREDLARAYAQLQTQLQQLPPSQEQGRRWLQGQIDRLQGRLRDLDEQLAEIRRTRLRADYEAALQTREPAPAPGGPAGAQAEQLLAVTERRLGTIESRLQELARGQEQLHQNINTIQQGLQDVRDQRHKEAGQLQVLGPQIAAIGNQLRAIEQQMRATGETSQSQQMQNQALEARQNEQMRQQEDLRNQLRQVQEQLAVLTRRAGPERKAVGRQFDRLTAEVQQLRETAEQAERDRLDVQADLRTEVQQLREQLGNLRGNVMQMQGALGVILSQAGRSTVGNAGYVWGW